MNLYKDNEPVSKISNIGLVVCILLGLGFWVGILTLTGCGPTAQQASMMTGTQLVRSHFREMDIMSHADMDVVNELVKRGGIPQSVADEYAKGSLMHSPRKIELWGRSTSGMFDWGAMGYKSWTEVRADFGRVSAGSGTTIYTSSGSFRITNYGGGTVRVRRQGTR